MVDVHLSIKLISEANNHIATKKGRMAQVARATETRGLVELVLQNASKPLELPCIVQITRIGPKELDSDNLQRACKAVRDGCADWFGLDDNHPDLYWEYTQQKSRPKVYGVCISVRRGRVVSVERAAIRTVDNQVYQAVNVRFWSLIPDSKL